MFRSFLLLVLIAAAFGSQELSELYKQYKASGKAVTKPKADVHSVTLADKDTKSRDPSLWVAPHAGQPTADYHPQLKKLNDGEEIIYYSWHVHVYFFHEDQNVTDRTLALRDQFISRFNLATCNDSCFMGGPFDSCQQGKCFNFHLDCIFNSSMQECVYGILTMVLMVLIPTASGGCTCPTSMFWRPWLGSA